MAGKFNTIDDFDIEGKTVLVRVDVNSPVDPGSRVILDDTRLNLHAQTIKELSNKGAKVVILAHQSRPGKNDFTTLSHHADALSALLNLRVKYIDSIFPMLLKKLLNQWKSWNFTFGKCKIFAEETISKSPEEQSKTIL